MVKAIGELISMSEYNGLVYLLRKFKKIVRYETINKKVLESDIGTLNIKDGLVNVGSNFILEDDVKIVSQNCLPLTTYNFTFYIVNVDTSEEITEVPITISGDTDINGNLEVTIPENILDDGEEIKKDFKLEITFQDHEFITPATTFNISLTGNKEYITNGETATVTATVTDNDGDPINNFPVNFDVNGSITHKTTDATGKATLTITGSGDKGLIKVKAYEKEIELIDYYFYDHATFAEHNVNYWSGNWQIEYDRNETLITLCTKGASNFCPSISPTQTDITKRLEFDTPYAMEFDIFGTSGNVHLRVWDGNISPYSVYFDSIISKRGHYRLIVKEDVIQLWVDNTLIEEAVNISDDTSVSFVTMKTTNPDCKHLNYANLVIYNLEPPAHVYNLNLSGTRIIESGDSNTITATLTDSGTAVVGETLDYVIKKGSTTISTGTTNATDSNGETTISYVGSGVGDVDIIVSKTSMSLEETFVIEDCVDYISGETDELTKFGSSIALRNNGAATLSYDSTNKYYKWALTQNNSESFIPINNATGLDDFTIEFDAYLKSGSGLGITGLTTYKDSNNWLRLSNIYNKKAKYLMDNGTGSESEVNATNIQNQWVHFKYTITEDTISKEIYSNDVLVDSASEELSSSFFTSSTKYGLPTLWGTSWNNLTYLKNFKIKAL